MKMMATNPHIVIIQTQSAMEYKTPIGRYRMGPAAYLKIEKDILKTLSRFNKSVNATSLGKLDQKNSDGTTIHSETFTAAEEARVDIILSALDDTFRTRFETKLEYTTKKGPDTLLSLVRRLMGVKKENQAELKEKLKHRKRDTEIEETFTELLTDIRYMMTEIAGDNSNAISAIPHLIEEKFMSALSPKERSFYNIWYNGDKRVVEDIAKFMDEKNQYKEDTTISSIQINDDKLSGIEIKLEQILGGQGDRLDKIEQLTFEMGRQQQQYLQQQQQQQQSYEARFKLFENENRFWQQKCAEIRRQWV